MPEYTLDQVILLAASWQALERIRIGENATFITDCVSVKLYAAYYIESSINFILLSMNLSDEINQFTSNTNFEYCGLTDKLLFYYNKFIANPQRDKKKDYPDNKVVDKILETEFPGFLEIRKFRNDLSHGIIKYPEGSLTYAEVEIFRKKAKEIVEKLEQIPGDKFTAQKDFDYRKVFKFLKLIPPPELSSSSSS
jgi:hypothetical protein